MGKIILIIGPMFSSKTTTLISYAKRYQLAKKRVALIKYAGDTRYSVGDICSHDKQSIRSTYACNQMAPIIDTLDIQEADVVLIDEAQFISDIVEIADKLANMGKIVILSALSGNYKREEFPAISGLIPKAEEIINLKAVCTRCGEDANFTKLVNVQKEHELVESGNSTLIGGEELYESRCRTCFNMN